MYNVDGKHSAWMFYIAKCIWGGLLASIYSVNSSWRWGDKNWYLKSIHHSSFINFPHPSATHCTLSLCFFTKTFIRSSEPLLPAPISSHRAEHNNAQWKCLVRIAECLLISLDEICIHLHLQLLYMVHQFLCFFAFSIVA